MVIYKITNLINWKIYIGQTIRDVSKRWSNHRIGKDKTPIALAIKKYGAENFKFEVIDGANSTSELNYLEQHYIYILNSLAPSGYNLKPGGNNHTPNSETILKIKAGVKGKPRPPCSEETKKKIADAHRGKKQDPELLAKLTEIRRSRPQTEKQKANLLKMIEGNKGKKRRAYKKTSPRIINR